ncbi:28133_t:CDS:2 [Dentiscutata erythropus]|uniref:28133_t:CDS:1 n=1 Tax=Dentiscutata erythropus TaxID=1348616 RepID=A0A9N9FLT5_9GLOM|nr:28133_t:CDS:2 [Dentiscutata erythropus]
MKLKANLDKCFFFRPHLQFLEHIVGRDRVCPDFEKIKKDLRPIIESSFRISRRLPPLALSFEGKCLGAVLAQKDDLGKEYVVAYASRALIKTEKNYNTTELECLAMLWVVKYFCHYFGLDPFFVVMNYAALKWLQTSVLTGRRAR